MESDMRTSWYRRTWFVVGLPVAALTSAVILGYRMNQQADLLKPNVPALELGCASCDYQRYFYVKDSRGSRPFEPDVRVELAQFKTILENVQATINTEDHGVIVHHGLFRSSDSTEYLYWPKIEFVGLKDLGGDEWDTVRVENGTYWIDLSSHQLKPDMDTHGWDNYKKYVWHYENSTDTVGDKSLGKTKAIVEGIDVKSYLFACEKKFDRMLRHNEKYDPTYVYFRSISEPLNHSGDVMEHLRHHVAAVLFGTLPDGNGDEGLLVDDANHYTYPFRMRALDVGSPCPYRCAKTYLPDNGIPVRSNCTVNDKSCSHTPKHYN